MCALGVVPERYHGTSINAMVSDATTGRVACASGRDSPCTVRSAASGSSLPESTALVCLSPSSGESLNVSMARTDVIRIENHRHPRSD